MDQLKNLIAGLNLRQRIYIVAAAVLVVAGIVAFTNWRKERDFRPLYTGLAPEDANALVQKLRETGAEYRLSENGTAVLAPSERIAELRISMAGAGLPKSGRVGFELFDKTNFGVTDFAERVNYRRALEGELERSVMALEEVESARVHVTFSKDSVFLEARQPAKASVLIKLRAGRRLAPPNVTAVCHLVASAVENLAPEAVSVLDMNGNLLSRPRLASAIGGEEPSEAALEYRRQIEKDLVAKINATLEPLLGAEKFRAGATVDCDFTSGEQSEETYGPSRPLSAHVVRRTRLPQGALRRMSISVLLDQNVRWEGTGAQARRIIDAPAPERIKAIRGLVAAATGLNAARGDQLIVESLPFESTLAAEPPGTPPAAPAPVTTSLPPWLDGLFRQKNPILLGLFSGALVLLLVAAFLFFRVREKRSALMPVQALGEGRVPAELEGREAEAAGALKLPPVTTKKTETLTKHLIDTAQKDPVSAAQILRTWLYDVD